MKKRIFMLAALAAGIVLCLAACGENNREPITITLWHVYGGEVNCRAGAGHSCAGGQRQQQRRDP